MARRGPMRRVLIAITTTVAASMLLGAGPAPVGARPGVTPLPADVPLVLGDAAAVGAGSLTGMPSVSGDGRYVVYHGPSQTDVAPAPSDATDAEDGPQMRMSVFLTDRETDESVELISVPEGLRTGDSAMPVISGDGCVVAIVTELALDVFRDDDSGERWDVYRKTLPHCEGGELEDWELVSTRPGTGGIARDDVVVERPTTSRSGTLVAFTHPADHLYEWDGITTVSLVDLTVPGSDPQRSRLVAGMPVDIPDTLFQHAGIDQPVLSDDGERLAYRSDATSDEAVPGWGTGLVEGAAATRQVFVWEVDEPDPFFAVDRSSMTPDGEPSSTGASEPSISRDGTVVAFTASDPALAPGRYPVCEASCPSQVFVADRDSNGDGIVSADEPVSTRLVSGAVDPDDRAGGIVAGVAPASQPVVAGDGDLIAFVTKASELQLIESPAMGAGDDGELLLATLSRDRLDRLTAAADGVLPTAGVHAHPDLDDTGRTVVFDTSAGGDLLGEPASNERRIVARTSPPRLSLEGADLGTTLVGVESDEWYVAVINDGPATFRPVDARVDDPEFTINRESPQNTCLLGAAVPAGGSCTIAIRYRPTSTGSDTATLTVFEEGFGAVEVSGSLAGEGGEPVLRILPAGIDFPTIEVGQSGVERQVDVTNVSILASEVGSFDITGDHADDFEITTNACVDRPLNPRAACSVGVTFTPSDAGRRTALLELSTVTGQYTTAIMAGDGEFAPEVALGADEVEAGGAVWATGEKYPPNTEVVVVFGDAPGDTITVTTDEQGAFAVPVPVGPDERGGSRRIVVQSENGAAASAPIDVIQTPTQQTHVGLPGFGLG